MWQRLRDGDYLELLRGLLDRVPPALFHFDILYVMRSDRVTPVMQTRTDVRAARITAADIARLEAAFPRSTAVYEARLAAGDVGFMVVLDDVVCGMGWLDAAAEHPEPEKYCTFVLPADTVWSYDLAILPEWRLTGAVPALRRALLEEAFARGRAAITGYVRWYNRKWLHAMERRLGETRAQRITVVNALGLRVHRVRHLGGRAAASTRIGFRSTARIHLAPAR